jgi:putative membrane protein
LNGPIIAPGQAGVQALRPPPSFGYGCASETRIGEDAAMVGFIIRVLIVAAGLWVASHIVPGIHYNTDEDLLLAAFLLGIVNAIIRPILVILTFPITIITLGLFLLVINGLMLELVAFFLHGFQVHGLIAAMLGAIVVGLTGWVASWFIGPSGRWETYRR